MSSTELVLFTTNEQQRNTHRVILQVIPVEKLQLLLGGKLTEAIAEKIYFLLYKPSSQFLPVTIKHTSSSPSPTFTSASWRQRPHTYVWQ